MAVGTKWQMTQQTFIQKGQAEAQRQTRVIESSDVSWVFQIQTGIQVQILGSHWGLRDGSMLLGFISLSH